MIGRKKEAEMVPQHTSAQAAEEKPIQAPTPAPGAELTNPPPGKGNCPCWYTLSPMPHPRLQKISSSFDKAHWMFSFTGFFYGGKMDFQPQFSPRKIAEVGFFAKKEKKLSPKGEHSLKVKGLNWVKNSITCALETNTSEIRIRSWKKIHPILEHINWSYLILFWKSPSCSIHLICSRNSEILFSTIFLIYIMFYLYHCLLWNPKFQNWHRHYAHKADFLLSTWQRRQKNDRNKS